MTSPLLPIFAALALCGILLPAVAQVHDAAPKCRYIDIGSLPLRYTGPNLELTTEGSINGAPATMLVDTGAFDTLLTRNAAERRKLPMRATRRIARGIGGEAAIHEALVADLSVGPTASGGAWLSVLGDFGFVPDYDALVGAPFLLQADLEISLASKSLRFFRPSNCDGQFLAYWEENAMEIPFAAPRGHRGPNPPFFVHVNGKRMRAMIDTGASATVIGRAAAERAGLKLDAPGVTRLSDIAGIGRDRVARWNTVFDTFQIAQETVRNAHIGVVDWDDDIDILLGADFLRSHRVLIAMSQRKIYLSYLGGAPFGQRSKLEPWIVAEAEAGNHDAQMLAAHMVSQGEGRPQDVARAADWIEKAALGGNPLAAMYTGHALVAQGFLEQGIVRLRHAAAKLPAHGRAARWLYLARVRNKQVDLARSELTAHLARQADQAWPRPVAEFYLGRITAETLLAQASGGGKRGPAHSCEALLDMANWHGAHGESAQEAALTARHAAQCAAAPRALQ